MLKKKFQLYFLFIFTKQLEFGLFICASHFLLVPGSFSHSDCPSLFTHRGIDWMWATLSSNSCWKHLQPSLNLSWSFSLWCDQRSSFGLKPDHHSKKKKNSYLQALILNISPQVNWQLWLIFEATAKLKWSQILKNIIYNYRCYNYAQKVLILSILIYHYNINVLFL